VEGKLYRFAMEKNTIAKNEKRRLYYCLFLQNKNERLGKLQAFTAIKRLWMMKLFFSNDRNFYSVQKKY
jgi:hypothetical protein